MKKKYIYLGFGLGFLFIVLIVLFGCKEPVGSGYVNYTTEWNYTITCEPRYNEVYEPIYFYNETNITYPNGTNETIIRYEIIGQSNLSYIDCFDNTNKIIVCDDEFKYQENNFECNVNVPEIVCDSKQDGNGDGICQDGETCIKLQIKNCKINIKNFTNGKKVVLNKKIEKKNNEVIVE